VNAQLGASYSYVGPQRGVVDLGVPLGDPNDIYGEYTRGRFSLVLAVNQLIYDGGRWWNQIAQADAQQEAARGQLAEQQLSSELEAVRRFYELLKAQLALKVLQGNAVRSREQVERAKALYEAGRSPRSAWYDARSNLSNDDISVVRQRQRIQLARLALLQWLGRPDADVEAVTPEGLDAPRALPDVEESVARAKTSRPLIKALEKNLAAAQLGTSIATAGYFPRLAARAAYSRGAFDGRTFFGEPANQNSVEIGATLSWDIFNGFGQQAQGEQARVEVRRAEAQQQQTLVDLDAELRRTWGTAAVEVEVLGLAREGLAIADEQLKLEVERFSAGAGSNLEVRNAQVKFTQAQLQVLTGHADVAVARAALARTIGGETP
jgi:outer membrane protein TolC